MSAYSERGDKLKKENKTAVDKQTAAKKDELDQQIDQNIQSAEQTVSAGIADADARYRGVVDSAAVQRELDRRQIQETMANMGLSRSGLNATQQTAVQLSAGNKQAAAAVQRQAAVDSLKQSLAEYRMKAETDRRVGKQSIEETAQKGIAEYDASVDKWVSEAESTEYKANQEATAKKYEADTEAATALAKMQYDSVQNQQEEAVERNLKLLDKMLEEGSLTPDIYAKAIENGWSYTYAKEFEKADSRIAQGQFATKDDAIAYICAKFPFPDGDAQDVNAAARDYLFSRAGITGDDITTFIKNNQNKTTE